MVNLIFHIKMLSSYIPVKIFNKWWSGTIAEILPVLPDTLNTDKTQSVRLEFVSVQMFLCISLHIYYSYFLVLFGRCLCSIQKYFFFICNFYDLCLGVWKTFCWCYKLNPTLSSCPMSNIKNLLNKLTR